MVTAPIVKLRGSVAEIKLTNAHRALKITTTSLSFEHVKLIQLRFETETNGNSLS